MDKIEASAILANMPDLSRGRFESALDRLNQAVADQKIYNVEFSDVKFALQNGIERALGPIAENFREEAPCYDVDISCYCQFNQAAGRIKRLTKRYERYDQTKTLALYLAALEEIAAINEALKSLKPFIVKGRRPAENPVEKDLTNTGLCSICGCRQKLNGDKMVHHGFQISDGRGYFGCRVGRCFGTGYDCYELGTEGNVAYEKWLQGELIRVKARLAHLQSGKVTEQSRLEYKRTSGGKYENVSVTYHKSVQSEAVMFGDLLRLAISETECTIRNIEYEITDQRGRIKTWTLQPLLYGRKP